MPENKRDQYSCRAPRLGENGTTDLEISHNTHKPETMKIPKKIYCTTNPSGISHRLCDDDFISLLYVSPIETTCNVAPKTAVDDEMPNANDKISKIKLFGSGLPRKEDYVRFYFGKKIKVLDRRQIARLAEDYEIKFETLCVDKAKKMKNLIIKEYGKIRGLKTVPLRSIFSFDFGTKIRKVEKRENVALTKNTLNRIKKEISKYKTTQKTLVDVHEESYNKIFTFIIEHLEFSEYIEFKKTGKFKISDIKIVNGSSELELRSWLIENLRHAFPKKFEIPLDNNLLSWFLFGDSPGYGEHSIVNAKLLKSEVHKRFELRELLGIDYRISKLTTRDFEKKGIEINQSDLDSLQQKVTYLIYDYILYKEHDKPYTSDTTDYGIEVGREYWSPEYFVIRAVFFATAESNNGEIKDFKTIGVDSSVKKIQRYLRMGYGFGKTYLDLLRYVEDLYDHRPTDSDIEVFKDAIKTLEKYDEIYFLRSKARSVELGGYDSDFERIVHHYLMSEINPLFVHNKSVVEAIGKREIVLKDEDGNDIIKRIHYIYHYDFYLELTSELRKYFGLDDRWKAIAVEAQGSYWHGQDHPINIERDKFKRAISEQENIIEIEIWDNIQKNLWISEFIRQINEQAGTDIIEDELSK